MGAAQITRRYASAAHPWADGVARVGYVTKGLVFILVGGLALAAAAGLGGRATDPVGALAMVAQLPSGRAVLTLVAMGLLAHVIFRVALVIVGEPYVRGGRLRKPGRQISNGFAAFVYLGMAARAGVLATGRGGHVRGNRNANTCDLSARVLAVPFGRWLLIGVAAGILVGGGRSAGLDLRAESRPKSACGPRK